ncbi:non-ribosomal peptide synthetase [Actinomadura verrucosospora]|uniref:Amino acid adenylation protein n=1 Tax=Actinomadura verrucosospora TaxID=46165 RepID=A0A7D3VVG7_ACTVE|nr:non-ribosomal peptide synthetase [Actinomadura verrucosospora]QKG19891.1 amino acid adenylation protein [Actinomadura verrucosospora]
MKDAMTRLSGLAPEERARLLARTRKGAPAGAARPTARTRPGGRARASFGQEQQWFLERLNTGADAAYIVPFALRLTGPLDVGALRAALAAVTRRHEVLRSRFEWHGSELFQVPGPDPAADLPVRTVTGGEDAARALAVDLARRRFDMAQGPLVRTELLVLGPTDHMLVWVAHHAVADGWSVGVLLDELGAAYRAALAGTEPDLPPLPVQYADFVEWQRERLTGERMDALVRRWRDRLGDAPPAAVAPDRARPATQTFRGATLAFALPDEVGAGLAELSARHGATLYMTLLAGLQVLLARHGGEPDAVVGGAFAGRPRREAEPLIGPLATTVPLRLDASGDPAFGELLERVKDAVLQALADQEIPFGRLVQELGRSRDPSRNPLYDMLFSMGSLPLGTGERALADGLTVRPVGLPNGTSRLDLELTMEQTGDGLAGRLDYNTDLYLPETAARLIEQFGTVLAGAVRAPDRPISEIPILAEDDAAGLLEDWARPERTVPVTGLVGRFAAMVREGPGREAVRAGSSSLDYAALDRRSDQVANALRDAGAGPGTVVAVGVDRDAMLLPVLLGVAKSGATYLPLDPDFPAERLRFMVDDSGASVLVRSPGRHPELTGAVPTVLETTGPEMAEAPAAPVPVPEDLDRVAYVMYTSGSTGRPKGVAVSHRALGSFAGAIADLGLLGPGDRTLALARTPFDGSVVELLLPPALGATIVVGDRADARDAGRLTALLDEQRITVLHGTPALWRLLLDAGWTGGPVRRLLSGAEALGATLSARLRERVPEVWNLYGPTEATVWALAQRVDEDGVPPIGRPLANVTAAVLDEHGRPVPPGVRGELYLGGPQVADGYLNRPELTAERFRGGRYRTGDRVLRRADGTLVFCGRTDDQVKIRGHRVELGEIENVLGRHPGVRDAVVVVHRFGADDDRLVGYVVPDGDAAGGTGTAEAGPDEADLRAAAAAVLPEYMLPARVVTLPELPLTPGGKIDRRALAAREVEAAQRRSSPASPPGTPTQHWMAALWEELLGRSPIGVHDDFFAAGGHSLLAVKILNRVRERCGVDVPLERFFGAPTVAGASAAVDEALAAGADADLAARVDAMSDEEVARLLGRIASGGLSGAAPAA